MTEIIQLYERTYQELSNKIKNSYPELLKDWDFKWSNRIKTSAGRACINHKTKKKWIEMSRKILELNYTNKDFFDRFVHLVWHEWCHALDWELNKGWGHGPSWKKLMREFGQNPDRCFDGYDIVCKPNNSNYAIKNLKNNRVINYYTNIPSDNLIAACKAKFNLDHNQLEVINLEHGWRRFF